MSRAKMFSRITVWLIIGWWLPPALPGWGFQEPGFGPESVEVAAPTRIDWTFAMGEASLAAVPDDWLAGYPSAVTYQLYVPESIDAETANGMVLFVPNKSKAIAVAAWREVCDEMGLIMAIPAYAGNELDNSNRIRSILDVLDDVRRRFQIDADRTYIAGYSGGGRTASRVAFSLPEYFGGLIVIGAPCELRRESWLRRRVAERLSVAFIAGSDDYARTEITSFRAPLLEASGVRTRVLVPEGLDHRMPASDTLTQATRWLEEDVERRRELADARPSTRIEPNQSPTGPEQAEAFWNDARKLMDDEATRFAGQMLTLGMLYRWGTNSDLGQTAGQRLMDDDSWKRREVEEFRGYVLDWCRGFSRYVLEDHHEHYAGQRASRIRKAIKKWEEFIADGSDATAIAEARERITMLEEALSEKQ